jgi:hypothetical protein
VTAKIERFRTASVVSIEDTPETVQARLDEMAAVEITDEHFQKHAAPARALKAGAVETLTAAVARLTREAQDRAELERHRQAERERQEREAAEAAERQRQEAEARAEEERQAAEARAAEERRQAEEAAAAAAAEQARQQAETRAREEQEARDREHQDQLRREQEAREAAERKAAAEAVMARLKAAGVIAVDDTLDGLRRRLREVQGADITAEGFGELVNDASAQKAAAETALTAAIANLEQQAADREAAEARQRDRDHRGKVMGEAKASLMAAGGIGEEAAKKIVLAIVAGEIPHVALTF